MSHSAQSDRTPLFSVTAEDCKWDYFRASGKGGQKRNKTSSAVRCTHIESGACGQSSDTRSQRHNRVEAFKRMASTEKFKKWLKYKKSKMLGVEKQIDIDVERAMSPRNIRIEIKSEDGRWIEERKKPQ